MTWNDVISKQSKMLMQTLSDRAEAERRAGKAIFPPKEDVFRALTLTQPEEVRIVIVGQDPYHELGQANGLAFSVNPGIKIPPSLRNIYQELQDDLGYPMPKHGSLAEWASRGVLLLNTVLTVEAGKANSHVKWGWQEFVLEVFRACVELPQPIVFVLWGAQARAFTTNLQLNSQLNKAAIYSSHPSPLSAWSGNDAVPAFMGSRPFSTANSLLQAMGGEPVNWSIRNI